MKQMIDLTMTLEHGQPGVEFEPKYTVEEKGWNARTLHLYSHTGTHMDAPFHFGVCDQTIEEIPLERFLVPGHLVDVPVSQANHLLPAEILDSILDCIEPYDAVLIRTGWSQHAESTEKYRNEMPRISEELARRVVEKQVGIVGVEGPSVADVNNLQEVTSIHQILLGGDVIIVEGLTNLGSIPDGKFMFGAMPLKVRDGDGSPCRAFALIE